MPPLPTTSPTPGNWTYASLTVLDGSRRLKPAQVGPDAVVFRDPPHLTSARVEIVVRNGDEEQRHFADVLPHAPEATRIPIRLHPPHVFS